MEHSVGCDLQVYFVLMNSAHDELEDLKFHQDLIAKSVLVSSGLLNPKPHSLIGEVEN